MSDTPISTDQYTILIQRIDSQDVILSSNSAKLDRIVGALCGDEFSVEEGLIKQVRRQEKRIKVLEVVYIGGIAVITVGGIVLGIINKLSITVG